MKKGIECILEKCYTHIPSLELWLFLTYILFSLFFLFVMSINPSKCAKLTCEIIRVTYIIRKNKNIYKKKKNYISQTSNEMNKNVSSYIAREWHQAPNSHNSNNNSSQKYVYGLTHSIICKLLVFRFIFVFFVCHRLHYRKLRKKSAKKLYSTNFSNA